jgi:hypothetical protein
VGEFGRPNCVLVLVVGMDFLLLHVDAELDLEHSGVVGGHCSQDHVGAEYPITV